MNKLSDNILIYHHLGLGDCIECNGMVRFYCEKYKKVQILCKKKYYEMVSYMYRDLNNLTISQIDEGHEPQQAAEIVSKFNGEVIIAGHQNYFRNINYFKQKQYGPAESFYEIASVPWTCRNEKFHFDRDMLREKEVYTKLNPENENAEIIVRYLNVHPIQ